MSNVKGFKQLSAALSKLGAKVTQEVKEIVAINTGDLELAAIRDAPDGGDPIRTTFGTESQEQVARGRSWVPISQAIGSQESPDGLSGTVFVERSAGEVAAWVEFSTGQDAAAYLSTVDKEWRDEARRFYVNGKGSIIGKPYIWPNYLKQRKIFISDLKKALENIKL